MTTERRDKFKRLAEGRVNKVLTMLDSIAKLSNKKNYDFTDEDVRVLFKALADRLSETKASFGDSSKEQRSFKFED